MVEYEPGDLTFTAEGGIPLARLQEATRAEGQWLPLDPPGSRKGTLGAMVALGVGGGLGLGYGTPRDHVLGLTLVTGDGRTLRWGGRVVKNVAGFDMTRLSIGSWGTLGVITSVSARLFPLPEREVTLLLRGRNARFLLPAARAMALSSLPLAAVELLDPVDGSSGGREGRAALVLRLGGPSAQVKAMEAGVQSELGEEGWGGAGLQRLEGEESRVFHEALDRWEEGAQLVLRLCLLPSELGSLLEEAEGLGALAKEAGGGGGRGDSATGEGELSPVRLSGHVGAGILRVAVASVPGEGVEAWVRALTELRGRLEGKGGSLRVSHGPLSLVEEVGPWGAQGAEAPLVRGLKEELDPEGILAPGRFVV
jgi:glycolate oxidase FAD binding subunit